MNSCIIHLIASRVCVSKLYFWDNWYVKFGSTFWSTLFSKSGEKLSKFLALFPILYLSGGTCVALIVLGGATCKMFFQIVCGPTCTVKSLTPAEWYLVFTCAAVILSQLPNLNSIAGVSLVGAITAVGYCTLIWVVSVDKGRLPHVSYNPLKAHKEFIQFFDVLNALGMIAFGFRGHNLILEIQVCSFHNFSMYVLYASLESFIIQDHFVFNFW